MPLASSRGSDGARDTTATIVAVVALASFPIVVAFARHDGAPVGADTPVYVWWARIVGAAGRSAISFRPGVPDVTEVIARAFGLSETATVAGLGCAVIAMLGLAGSAVLRAGRERPIVPLLGLALTGLFGTYLAAGHLSNAVFAALFVPAIAFMLDERRSASVVAAVLVGTAGIAHPEFLWLGGAILAGAAALALVVRLRREATATLAVGLAGAGITAIGLLAASVGGVAFDVPTSLDVFLLQYARSTGSISCSSSGSRRRSRDTRCGRGCPSPPCRCRGSAAGSAGSSSHGRSSRSLASVLGSPRSGSRRTGSSRSRSACRCWLRWASV